MTAAPDNTPDPGPPLTQTRDFWLLIGRSVVLGVLGALVGLIFMGVIGYGGKWYTDTNTGWWGGKWWWIGVTTAAGLLVGLLRLWMRMPEHTPGLIADLKDEHVNPKLMPAIVAVSAVSLAGGASLGPEKALGTIGGGVASYYSKRRGLTDETSRATTLAGFAGAYGGLFSSPVIVVMMMLEVARPGGRHLTKVLVGSIVASSFSFGVYFAIAGSVFLDAYPVPAYNFADWHLLAGVLLGLLATVVVTLLVLVTQVFTKVFERAKIPAVIKPVIGGMVFGLVGVALPLTMFTGSDQLKTVLADSATLSIGVAIALILAKIISFAVSQGSGFVGGPIFPTLFIGGTAGVLVHLVIPGVPVGLAFACLLAAVPGAMVAAPFTMVLLAAFLTEVGALETAPILIAVITAFLTMEGVKYMVTRRQAARQGTSGKAPGIAPGASAAVTPPEPR